MHVLDSCQNHYSISNATLEKEMKSIPEEERENVVSINTAHFCFRITIQE